MSAVHYFGCLGDKGHYLWKPSRGTTHMLGPLDARLLDTLGVLVEGLEPTRMVLTHLAGRYTLIQFKDRTVDQRPGSHSIFIMEGVLGKDEAYNLARNEWPEIWARRDNLPLIWA